MIVRAAMTIEEVSRLRSLVILLPSIFESAQEGMDIRGTSALNTAPANAIALTTSKGYIARVLQPNWKCWKCWRMEDAGA